MDLLQKKESKKNAFLFIPTGENPPKDISPPEKKSPVSITAVFVFASFNCSGKFWRAFSHPPPWCALPQTDNRCLLPNVGISIKKFRLKPSLANLINQLKRQLRQTRRAKSQWFLSELLQHYLFFARERYCKHFLIEVKEDIYVDWGGGGHPFLFSEFPKVLNFGRPEIIIWLVLITSLLTFIFFAPQWQTFPGFSRWLDKHRLKFLALY